MQSIRVLGVWLGFACLLTAGAQAITIGAGPVIGTNKNANVTGNAVWYQEFQDWKTGDLRVLDTHGDAYAFGDGQDYGRDLVALYSHDDGTNVYFRVDVHELAYQQENSGIDVYVVVDCADGGTNWLPDFVDTRWSELWDVCVAVYNSSAASVYDSAYGNHPGEFVGSYWRSDLDGVEFGLKRAFLVARGWNGSSPLKLAVFTVRDGTNGGAGEIYGSDLVDFVGNLTRSNPIGAPADTGYLDGYVLSTATAGRAKYAAIAHANQSLNSKQGTQNHIYTDYSATLKPGFVRLMDSAEMLNVPVNLHISGTLLMSFAWATQDPATNGFPTRDGPTFLNRVRQFVTPGQGPGSLIGGVLAEHIMPYFEGEVNRKSIEQNNEVISNLFGLGLGDLQVMHIPERVFHTDTNSPHVNPAGPLKGKPFEDIVASGFQATYLDEVTHLHWWFYPNEQTNAGWDDDYCGRWAGGLGNDEETYHHKVHKINGVYTFMINDREDQEKFGNDDSGMQLRTRASLLEKALHPDYAQLTVVFDDWEAFAGNSFASSTPNNNADQWDRTLRWAANHPWIELVNLKQVLAWAQADPAWVIDQGYVYNKSMQTYEWLKRASEQSYDNWYYGSGQETNFFSRVPPVNSSGWVPGGMKNYGDLNTTNTLLRDTWDRIQAIAAPAVKKLAEWSYSAMIYETAWHDEDANPDQYKSRNYQVDFNRSVAQGNCDDSVADTTGDPISGWALKLHGHVRDLGVLKAASDWVQNVKSGQQGEAPTVYAADLDDDQLWEYVVCNNKVFLCFERWGARLVKAFVYDAALNGGDARAVVGAPVANPPDETENEWADNSRCSAFKDRYCTGQANAYVDMDFAASVNPASNGWTFVSSDGRVTKVVTLQAGRDVVQAEYRMDPSVGTLYTRYGLGPHQLDLMLNGHVHLSKVGDLSFRGLRNSAGGEAYVVAGRNLSFINGAAAQAGWDNRELPLVEQFETESSSTNWTVALAFSEASARDLDGDGLNNTNEFLAGTNHELADSDGDGMTDGYEVENGLSATSPDGGGDRDEDGFSNWAEFVAGTAAGSATSYLAASSSERQPGGFLIRHGTVSGRWYEVLFSDALGTGTWRTFSNAAVGRYFEGSPAAQHTFTDDYSSATSGGEPVHGARSYGIRVSKP